MVSAACRYHFQSLINDLVLSGIRWRNETRPVFIVPRFPNGDDLINRYVAKLSIIITQV
jgi:hypothetical protein